MKLFAIVPILAILSVSPAFSGSLKDTVKDEVKKELTGDQKDACEALLCLSSSERPSECNPSLHRYFNISHKHLKDTLNARKAFLSLCPAVDDDKQMPSLVNAIANGAGRCDLAGLNQNAWQQCHTRRVWDSNENTISCNPQLPSYCKAYYSHSYTNLEQPKWQCTQTVKEAKFVYDNANNNKRVHTNWNNARIEQVERCVAGKWVL